MTAESNIDHDNPIMDPAEIADRYFEELNRPIFDPKNQPAYNPTEDSLLSKLKDIRSKLPSEEDYDLILISAITKAKRMPESLYISKEAFAKIEENKDRYTFEFADSFPRDEVPEELCEYYDTWAGGRGIYLLAKLDGNIVGFSVIEIVDLGVAEVSYQAGLQSHPGVGLLMLEEILNHFQNDQEIYKIELATSRMPYGLGNLGFTLAGHQDTLCLEFNQLSFEKWFDKEENQ